MSNIKEFACVAEAVAHYYTLGYETNDQAEIAGVDRVMVNKSSKLGIKTVHIRHLGLLEVIAQELPLV